VAWIVEEAERAPVYCAWEDLHWVDPSTLEVLTLVLDQVPTSRLLALLTFRPEFPSPWRPRSHITQLTLSRLGRPQVEAMVGQVTGGKALPTEVVQQIVSKTDGVPLFVEELTKMVVESGLLREEEGRYVGTHTGSVLQSPDTGVGGTPIPPLAIPSTLQDSLMARLDRLAPVRELVQLGATLGREFSYELLHAVSSSNEETLRHGLRQLVEAELIYQRGLPPQATYLFKHALIQDTAYQSLLKSTRQQYHHTIAQVLEERFPDIKETQPELLARHYTEAGLKEQAIPYWQQAGQRAGERSANVEAMSHLATGLELLKTLPDTPGRAQQELVLQFALSNSLMATKGYAAPEVEQVYVRALELCRQIGEPPQLFPVLVGLWRLYITRAEHKTARQLGEQCLSLAQRMDNPVRLLGAHQSLGITLFTLGEFTRARAHLEQAITLYDPKKRHFHASRSGQDPGVACLTYAAWTTWALGYPDQALKRSQEALTLAQGLSHPLSLAQALIAALRIHQQSREGQTVQEQAEALITLSTEHQFAFVLAWGTIMRGWAVAEQGQKEEGLTQMRQGLAAHHATGAEANRPYYLACLAEVHGQMKQAEEGLNILAEALAGVDNTEEREYEAELYRLKGMLTLQAQVQGPKSQVGKEAVEKSRMGTAHHHVSISEAGTVGDAHPTKEAEAEDCFWKAIEIARRQQAKSLELRAVMSLSRLWQQQGKQAEARQMLAEIYGWFTEGFDTKDLQEGKALLEELG
jgi:predicted ATPase